MVDERPQFGENYETQRLYRILASPRWQGGVVLRGNWPAATPCVAIVGSRKPTTAQCDRAFALGRTLTQRGALVCSGGARGIDAAALRGAVAAGGPCVAVLPCHPDQPYPPEHAELYDKIVEQGGALLALAGHLVHPGLFPRRNKLLAEFVHGLIAVAADLGSGTLLAARAAVEAGAAVAVVAWSAGVPRTAGLHWLQGLGAPAIAHDGDLAQFVALLAAPQQPDETSNVLARLRAGVAATSPEPRRRSTEATRRSAVDACHTASPSYAVCAGAAAPPQSAPATPADLASWPEEAQKCWAVLVEAPARRLTLEELIPHFHGSRAQANATLFALVLAGRVRLADDGRYAL